MAREVALADLRGELDTLAYPVTREDAISEFDDVVVVYDDGQAALDAVLSRTTEEVFVSVEDLEAEVWAHLPEDAADEPTEVEEG